MYRYGVVLRLTRHLLSVLATSALLLTLAGCNFFGGSGVDTTVAAHEVTSLVNNPSVVGIVGPFNSLIARDTMPITNASGLTMISPATTNPGLTLEQYASANGIPVSCPTCNSVQTAPTRQHCEGLRASGV